MTTAYGAASARPRATSAACSVGRAVHHRAPVVERAGLLDRRRLDVAVLGAERLPLERQQPMALQIAEGAVVGEDVESIVRALERAARLVPPVGALADVGAEQRGAFVGRHPPRDRQQLIVRQTRDA